MHQREQGFSRTHLWFPGYYAVFSNNKKMVTILHRELEHKIEKVQHMKLEVMRPKTKNKMITSLKYGPKSVNIFAFTNKLKLPNER